MKSILALSLLITLSTIGFGQKLKSDGFEISIKSIEKQETDFFGKKQEIYVGIVKVKSKDSQKGEYRFYFPKMDGKFSHLTIRNSQDQILEPRLYYDEENKSFKYHEGTDKEAKEKVLSDKSIEEIILSGALIWLKIDK